MIIVNINRIEYGKGVTENLQTKSQIPNFKRVSVAKSCIAFVVSHFFSAFLYSQDKQNKLYN